MSSVQTDRDAEQSASTVAGWSAVGGEGTWVASQFLLTPFWLGIHQNGASAPHWEALTAVTGLDQLGADAEGLPILEFLLAGGKVVHARIPEPFVDEIVEMLQRSREVPPAPPASPPVTDAPADEVAVADEPAADEEAVEEPVAEAPAAEEPVAEETVAEAPVAEEPVVEERVADSEAPPADIVVEDPPPPPAGRSNTRSSLAKEVQALREYLDGFGFPERRSLKADIDSLIAHRTEVLAEVRDATLRRREQEAGLVRARRDTVLQDAGIYHPRLPAEDSPVLAERLADTRRRIDEVVESAGAVSATDDWTVNGSRTEGRKVVGELAALLLRTYNAEAEVLAQQLRPSGLDAAVDRLNVTRSTIERLGTSMSIVIDDELHRLWIEELTIAADHLAAVERAELAATGTSVTGAGAGHLYVASNLGAFGEGVVRIGATSTTEPAALSRELSTGLPFTSDVHTVVASGEIAALLGHVRSAFEWDRLDLGDPDCEFFRVEPVRVRDLLVEHGVEVAWFVVEPVAEAWRQSENTRAHEHE